MTMCSHLAKRVRAFSSPQYQSLTLLTPLLRSSFSAQTQSQPQPPKELPFIAEYLTSSFNFSSNRALKVSACRNLASIKSPARPEAVVKFLHDTGLTDVQIKSVVTLQPTILACSVDKTIRPNVLEFLNGGYSGELLAQLIRHSPFILISKNTHSKLLFWRDFVGKDDEALLKIISKNPILLGLDIEKKIIPVINLLKEYGLSNIDILLFLQKGTRVFGPNLDSLRRTLQIIEELGILRCSTKFCYAVRAVGGISEDTIRRNVEFFKEMCGLAQEDVSAVFRKFPTVFSLSEENLKSKMKFLIEKVGIEPSSIASYPAIFGYSLERVLMARYNVLSALEAKGLKIKCSFLTACHMSEKRFSESYVVPFEKDVPGLCHAYMAARGVKGMD